MMKKISGTKQYSKQSNFICGIVDANVCRIKKFKLLKVPVVARKKYCGLHNFHKDCLIFLKKIHLEKLVYKSCNI